MDIKAENYSDSIYTNIIFEYHVVSSDISKNMSPKLSEVYPSPRIANLRFGDNYFPITTDYNKWGVIVSKTKL